MTKPTPHPAGAIHAEGSGATRKVVLAGRLGLRDLAGVSKVLDAEGGGPKLTVDLSGAEVVDTAIAWAIATTRQRIESEGGTLEVVGARPEAAQILQTVTEALPKPEATVPDERGLLALLESVGRTVAAGGHSFAEALNVLGLFLQRLGRSILRPREFRLTALVHHCEAVGLQAVPIVALLSFLIGVVLAYQGASQLRQFGAEVFVVDLIAISVLRELGILLTAIIVAGRTASSFTSAIGSMKMREEIDAMRTLGIDPADALIVPRVLALLLMLPILGLIANLSGLIGGALMSWIELGISPDMFRIRLQEGVDLSHVMVGMVKAPVFAVIIGVIGCRDGLRVSGTAESLGRMTSTSVVASVFAVIVVDALFSIFFARLGI